MTDGPKALVIDASVALKWVLPEEGSDQARSVIGGRLLIAPDLLFVECANVLWTKVRRGLISPHQAQAALAAIDATPIRSVTDRSFSVAAQALALELDRSVYDCLYLAVAIQERAVLVTADAAFARVVLGHARYADKVLLLAPAADGLHEPPALFAHR